MNAEVGDPKARILNNGNEDGDFESDHPSSIDYPPGVVSRGYLNRHLGKGLTISKSSSTKG